MGANVIGFQALGYARHFISSCMRILGCETTSNSIDYGGVPVKIVVQPIGTDPERIRRMQSASAVQERILSLKETFKDVTLILGLDTSDHSRGIIHKLKAFEKLLSVYPQWIGQVTLLQVIYSAGDSKSKLDSRLTQLASKISSKYGSLDYTPVHIYNQSVDHNEYLALLSTADILLVTSERDSVTTLILDYLVCQEEASGVPIVSEFVGLAGVVPSKYQVNPWDHMVHSMIHL